MNRCLYLYPIVLTVVGVGIHFFGMLRLFQLEVSGLAHTVMFAIDLLVVVGLFRKSTFGYWLAILLYSEQSIMQPYWAYHAYIEGQGLFQILVTCPLVIGALFILISNKPLFLKNALNRR